MDLFECNNFYHQMCPFTWRCLFKLSNSCVICNRRKLFYHLQNGLFYRKKICMFHKLLLSLQLPLIGQVSDEMKSIFFSQFGLQQEMSSNSCMTLMLWFKDRPVGIFKHREPSLSISMDKEKVFDSFKRFYSVWLESVLSGCAWNNFP